MHTHPLILEHLVAERRARLLADGTAAARRRAGRGTAVRRPTGLRLAMAALALVAGPVVTGCEPRPPGPRPVPAPAHSCDGKLPTILGTAGDDTLVGTAGDDVIVARAGNDTIKGGGGDDRVCGDAGTDTVWGEAGNDSVDGGPGSDTVHGGLDHDAVKDLNSVPGEVNRLTGGPGDDSFEGSGGTDTIDFGLAPAGVDVDLSRKVARGQGDDHIVGSVEGVVGSPFADRLYSGDEDDALDGQGGDDLLVGGQGDDRLTGGAGQDRVSYHDALVSVSVALWNQQATSPSEGRDALIGIEDVTGSRNADSIIGDAGPNVLDGAGGYDACAGWGGTDTYISCP